MLRNLSKLSTKLKYTTRNPKKFTFNNYNTILKNESKIPNQKITLKNTKQNNKWGKYLRTFGFLSVLLVGYYKKKEYDHFLDLELENLRVEELKKNLVEEIEIYVPRTKYEEIIHLTKLTLRSLVIFLKLTPLMLLYPFTKVSSTVDNWWYNLLLYTIRSLGPTFIKIGQWISSRPDLFSPKLVNTLAELHTCGSVHSFSDTRAIIKQAFGVEIEELFEEFSVEPIASGSIAQVHKAKLKKEFLDQYEAFKMHEYVAVKVRHPGIEGIMTDDLKIGSAICSFLKRFRTFDHLNLDSFILSFGASMKEQINLDNEAINLNRFIDNFKDVPAITFPTPIANLHHPLVLVESFLDGLPISNYYHHDKDDEQEVELAKKIASQGVVMYLKMMIDNFLHGDLHPGNIMVKLDKNMNPSLIILDVGLVAEMKGASRDDLLNLFSGIAQGKGYQAAEYFISRSNRKKYAKEKIEAFKQEMGDYLKFIADKSTPEIEVGKSFGTLLEIAKKFDILIDTSMATAIIGTIVMDGLGRQLNPDLDFISESVPVFTMSQKFRGEYLKNRFKSLKDELIRDWDDLIEDFNN